MRRKGMGRTQVEMAQALEISQSHYAQFESGKKSLSMDHLLKILEELRLEILPRTAGMNSSWVSSFMMDTNSSIEEVIENLEYLNKRLQEMTKNGLIDLDELSKYRAEKKDQES